MLLFCHFRNFRRKTNQKLLAGLCVSLLLAVTVFTTGIQAAPNGPKEGCWALGIILHVFLLHSFIWMGAVAINISLEVVVVFNPYGDKLVKMAVAAVFGETFVYLS